MIEQKAALLAVYAVLLLVACILPFALQLRAYKYPSAWTIDRVYGVALALGGLALLAVRPWPGLTSPVVLSIAFAAPLVSFGRRICHRRTPGPASGCLGDVVGSELAAGCDPGWDLPDCRRIGCRASAPAAQDRRARPLSCRFWWYCLLGVAAVRSPASWGLPKALEPCGTTGPSTSARRRPFWAGRSHSQTTPCNMEWALRCLSTALCGQECWSGTYIAAAATNLLYLLAMAGRWSC